MWGVLSLLRQRGAQRRRVVDESALGVPAAAATAGALARAFLGMARGAARLRQLGGGKQAAAAEEAWAASGWRPARAPDEVGHLVARESLRYAIYA